MAGGNTLLDYGIAVNFFGNYRQEANSINTLTNRLNSSLTALQGLVIGGGITAALYKFGNGMLTLAKSMEQNFANLKSILGSSEKAIETLEWARKKGASTPFEIEEVNNAVGTMTTMGFNKNNKMREEVFQAVGDFAALKGFDFADMMQRVSKATFGNWESLGDRLGVRRQTIGIMAREQMSRTPEKFAGQEADINKAIQLVEKGKQGTEEYKMAIVKLIGVLGKDGMLNRLNTIAGAWSNVNDLVTNFMSNMVGYTQVQGTLANAVKTTIVDKILKPFSEAHTVVINGVKETTTSVDQLGRIGKGVGDILIQVWGMVDSQIGNSTNSIKGWIDKLDAFFRDYENNVAPIVLFIYLIRLQVEEFLKGFYDGFSTTFKWFVGAGMMVWQTLGKIVEWLGITDGSAKDLGKTLGSILGVMLGIKAFKLIVSPLNPLINSAKTLYGVLIKSYNLILVGEGWTLKDSVLFRWALFKERISAVTTAVKTSIVNFAKLAWQTGTNLVKSMWRATMAVGQFIWKIGIQTATLLGSAISGITTYAIALGTTLWTSLITATAAVWSFTVALLANPITWIVIAVIALVGVIIWMILNWDKVKKAFIDAWNWTVKGLKDMWKWVKDIGKKIWDWLSKVWTDVKQFFIDTWNGIYDWFVNKITSLITWFSDAWKGVKDFLGMGDEDTDVVVKKKIENTNTGKFETISGSNFKQNGTTTNQNFNVPQMTIISPDPAKAGQSVKDALTPDYLRGLQGKQGK